MRFRGALVIGAFFLCAAAPATYDPAVTFAPLTLPTPASAQRSAAGVPGAAYWQNRADYTIRVTLDPAAKSLSGSEIITYTNHSPDALGELWLQLDQNIYRSGSRGAVSRGGVPAGNTDGFVIEAVTLETGGKTIAATTQVSDTRLHVDLARPLASGAVLKLQIRFHFTIPGTFGGRMGWGTAKAGEIYDLAQFYPRMAVYDDLRGWDTAPYLAQEFYLEYGDFNTISSPCRPR